MAPCHVIPSIAPGHLSAALECAWTQNGRSYIEIYIQWILKSGFYTAVFLVSSTVLHRARTWVHVIGSHVFGGAYVCMACVQNIAVCGVYVFIVHSRDVHGIFVFLYIVYKIYYDLGKMLFPAVSVE